MNNQDNKKDELHERLINIRRVVKVVKGGRIFGFSALSVVGDGQGMIGMGQGKAREVPVAVQKSIETAKKSMQKVQLRGHTLHHPVQGRHGATRVILRPLAEGKGIIAGGAMRAIFEVVGVQNGLGKTITSSNPVNVVRATIKALAHSRSPQSQRAKLKHKSGASS